MAQERGSLEAHDVRMLAMRIAAVEKKFEHIEKLISETHDAVIYARGGMRMVLAMGTAMAVLTGLAIEVIRWIRAR